MASRQAVRGLPRRTPFRRDVSLQTYLANIFQTSITSISGLSNPANLSSIIGGDLNWNRTIQYTYTQVPEPASMSLLALGDLGLLRRRS